MSAKGTASGGTAVHRVSGASTAVRTSVARRTVRRVLKTVGKDGKREGVVVLKGGGTIFVTAKEATQLVALSQISASTRGKIDLLGTKGTKVVDIAKLSRNDVLKLYNAAKGKNYKRFSQLPNLTQNVNRQTAMALAPNQARGVKARMKTAGDAAKTMNKARRKGKSRRTTPLPKKTARDFL